MILRIRNLPRIAGLCGQSSYSTRMIGRKKIFQGQKDDRIRLDALLLCNSIHIFLENCVAVDDRVLKLLDYMQKANLPLF